MKKPLFFPKAQTASLQHHDQPFDPQTAQLDLPRLLQTALVQKHAVALWRKPLPLPPKNGTHLAAPSEVVELLISFAAPLPKRKMDLEELTEGFVVAPFEEQEEVFFLEKHLFFSSQNSFFQVEKGFEAEKIAFWKCYQELSQRAAPPTFPYHLAQKATRNAPTEKAQYLQTVARAIAEMQQPEPNFEKVVLSRTKKAPLSKDFNLWQLFQKATQTYPQAFVAAISLPKIGTWFCATPELLISQDQKGIFRTIALAGTQPFQPHTPLSEVLWRQKEIEEQAMVSRYIINCFKKIRLREFSEVGPRTAVAGNLMHLRTDFAVDTQKERFPQLATVMLELLHPTSAVCGLPKDTAHHFIKTAETHKRNLYCGYLGTVHLGKDADIFVMLRCMELFENEALLYAGGGITADSKPEQEWQETEFKTQTLLKLLS
ncbi:chorismate-binding protein [Hugenholtzia roseola]|uniref:chorismate-binding protein n=1 Tax=Hugenholtzia roseola TaxID=1002 RepID=UPI00042622EE|nr:chorismate-binding protein [Hugenholtzia roseola]